MNPTFLQPPNVLTPASHTIILDSNSPRFYHQFSAKKSDYEVKQALQNLDNFSALQVALLHFVTGTHLLLADFIIQHMDQIFHSDDPKHKGIVFIHLIKSINRIRQDLTNELYDDYEEKVEKVRLLSRLEKLVHKLNNLRLFQWLDLSYQSLNNLDLTGFRIDLSYTNFRCAYVINTDFSTTILIRPIFDGVDLSNAKGVDFTIEESDSSTHSEESSKVRCVIN